MPVGYANVRMSLQRDAVPLHIPASALIFNGSGLRVATVGADDKVKFKAVTIARDLGKDIELASGISADDRVIVAPPDELADGDQVRVAGAGPKGKPEKAAGKTGREGVGAATPRPSTSPSLRIGVGSAKARFAPCPPSFRRVDGLASSGGHAPLCPTRMTRVSPPATPARHPPP